MSIDESNNIDGLAGVEMNTVCSNVNSKKLSAIPTKTLHVKS